MRYFTLEDTKLIAMPPQAEDSFMAWVHWDSDNIEREHIKPEQVWGLHEITEKQARELDPVMFSQCLERPYYEADTLIQFYIDRAMQYQVDPPQLQVEKYLIKSCGMIFSQEPLDKS